MGVNNTLFDKWLDNLERETEGGIVGIYEHGSSVWGFSDEYSDKDFIVIWRSDLPNKEEREKLLKGLGGKPHDFKDIPTVGKGIDMFELERELFNVGHLKSNDFFKLYNNLKEPSAYYEEYLLRIGGFVYGKIHHDCEGELEKYKSELVLTENIKDDIINRIKNGLENDLRLMNIALERNSSIRVVWLLHELLRQLHTLYYLRKNKWPMSDKWFEKFAEEEKWKDDFVLLINRIKENTTIRDIAKEILAISKTWGFEPSTEISA